MTTVQSHQFVEISGRQLLLTAFVPDDARHCVVLIPPFGEELNKSRRMMALQARALSSNGLACCYLDLSGTGDSEGDLGTIRWQDWVAEMHALVSHLTSQFQLDHFDFVGIRLGALLACEIAPVPGSHIVFWQPVTDGATYVRQLFRLRLMADKLSAAGARSSEADLRNELAQRGHIEVAGYRLGAGLLEDVGQRNLLQLLSGCAAKKLSWFEVGPHPQPGPAVQRALAQIPGDFSVNSQVVSGEPFWSTVEIGVAPQLITATTEVLSR